MSELERAKNEIPTASDGPKTFFITSNQSTYQKACESPKVESEPCDSPKMESPPTGDYLKIVFPYCLDA